ncbi:MAG: FAD-dependent oxidoreductase [Ramlibacter sp.]|uniref:FAD-dependent monooxygenase n=1 Tax=Ramlibacter sp. TaxID=1917967 RepID=UPI00263409B0|nr:FAD-dependent monooxygenase [Ramlibacter sp.]MDB5751856.1 FAD-dependent oxidoreductase [Ramlibacter sp.]
MSRELLIAGGGLGGLAAAIAARRAGWEARLFEQAWVLSEVGAGIQLGPNATRILREWGLLEGALREQAFEPQRLRVRDGVDGAELASLPLGGAMEQRYGAPYLTLHRADLQAALLAAAMEAGLRLHTGRKVERVSTLDGCVRASAGPGPEVEGEALVAADGLWSEVRAGVVRDGPPAVTGHLAYRGLVRQADLPPPLRSREVTVWLAPRMHLVTYPVRGGEVLNAVCVVEGGVAGDPRSWDQLAVRAELEAALGPACAQARDQIAAIPEWRLWALHDRPPVGSADCLAQGRVALLGDAAHPMRPYLAQGAGMAIEDARELQRVLAIADDRVVDVPTAFRRYALNRWQRVARVQAGARRNGTIFHAQGPLRAARNLGLRLLGARLLDQPWLYGAGF